MITRFASTLLLILPLTVLAGCSQDFASVDDVYVPALPEQRFPIGVVERPVKMTVPAVPGRLPAGELDRLAGFAKAARENATSPIAVTYPSGSHSARGVSQQAVKVLISQGVPRSRIQTASYHGKSDVVSLAFTRRVAATKPCGDWTRNVAVNERNEPYPDFACSYQSNFAAMAKNPQDFERPRAMGPTYAAGRMPAVESYQSGTWLNQGAAAD
jgi:pilus biogenesis lipoprotein CpaD